MERAFIFIFFAVCVQSFIPYQQYLSAYVASNNRFGDSVYIGPGRPWVIPVQNPTTVDLSIIYPSYDNNDATAKLFSVKDFTIPNDPVKVALSPAEGIKNNLFVSSYIFPYSGNVLFYQGEYTTWSVQQILSPPDIVAKNYFGSTLALDADSNFETLFIGCGNCSSDYGKQHGVIYLYEQNKGPGRKNTWSATQKISHRNLEGLGRDRIVPHKDLLMASTTTRHYPVLLFRRKGKDTYEPEQILGVGESINSFDVYDDTIVLAASNVASGVIPNVGAIYILAPAKLAAPKGKPQPVQWSLQQVLRPDPISEGLLFGNSMSLDKNRLAVIEGIKPDTLAWVNPDTSQFTSLALNTPVAINFLGTGDVTMTRTSAIGSPISLDTWSRTFTTPVGSLSNPDWVLGPRFYFELSCDTTGNSGSTVSYEFQFAGGLETTAQLFFIDFDWSEKVTIKAYDASNNLIPFADTTIELSPGGDSTPRYADISWTASGGATGLLRNINDDSESNIIASISSSINL